MPPQPMPASVRAKQETPPYAGGKDSHRESGIGHGIMLIAIPIVVAFIVGGAVYALQFEAMQKQQTSITAMNNQLGTEISGLVARVSEIEKKTQNTEGDSLQTMKAQLEETISALETKMSALEAGASDMYREEGMVSYMSRHGFRIAYPSYWHAYPFIEKYPTVPDAQVAGLNKFVLTSYVDETASKVPADEIKITVWVDGNMTKTLGEWVGSLGDVLRVSDTSVGGKPAEKVWRTLKDGSTSVAVYYAENGKGVIFSPNSANSPHMNTFDAIVSTFRFISPQLSATP